MTETQEQQAKDELFIARLNFEQSVEEHGRACDSKFSSEATRKGLFEAREDAWRRLMAALRSQVQTERTPELEKLKAFANAVNEIRRDIIGRQTISWSAHVYPLVAALHEAGYESEGYEEAKANAMTLISEVKRLEAELAVLRSAPALTQGEHEDGGTSLTAGDGVSVSVPAPELPHAGSACWSCLQLQCSCGRKL